MNYNNHDHFLFFSKSDPFVALKWNGTCWASPHWL